MPLGSLNLSIPSTGAMSNSSIREALRDLLNYKDLVVSKGGYIQDEKQTFNLFLQLFH